MIWLPYEESIARSRGGAEKTDEGTEKQDVDGKLIASVNAVG